MRSVSDHPCDGEGSRNAGRKWIQRKSVREEGRPIVGGKSRRRHWWLRGPRAVLKVTQETSPTPCLLRCRIRQREAAGETRQHGCDMYEKRFLL